jgi:hypothetical protein
MIVLRVEQHFERRAYGVPRISVESQSVDNHNQQTVSSGRDANRDTFGERIGAVDNSGENAATRMLMIVNRCIVATAHSYGSRRSHISMM